MSNTFCLTTSLSHRTTLYFPQTRTSLLAAQSRLQRSTNSFGGVSSISCEVECPEHSNTIMAHLTILPSRVPRTPATRDPRFRDLSRTGLAALHCIFVLLGCPLRLPTKSLADSSIRHSKVHSRVRVTRHVSRNYFYYFYYQR